MIKALLLHHNFIKIISCIIGYTLWAFLANYQTITICQFVPVCFYQIPEQFDLAAPDSIKLSLSGQRKDIYLFDLNNSAIHIDASQYQEGKHQMLLTREHLFLPDKIFLQRLEPSHLSFEVIKK